MLGREGARRGNAFDVGKQQTSGREWNDPFDVAQPQRGSSKEGRPAGTSPVVGTPRSASPNADAITIDSATTASPPASPAKFARPAPAAGSRGRRARAQGIGCRRVGLLGAPPAQRSCVRRQERRPGLAAVIAIVNPAPALKPTRMLSLISRTRMLSRRSQATRQNRATIMAARLASGRWTLPGRTTYLPRPRRRRLRCRRPRKGGRHAVWCSGLRQTWRPSCARSCRPPELL
jgi:hypothetical protein